MVSKLQQVSWTKRIRLTRAQSHAQTRERLLVAARQVFARHGFGGASVDMIAAEAGYSKGAIYSNFETKEAILFELLERYAEEQIADFKAIMQLDPGATRDASTKWLDTMNTDMDWDVVTMELQLHARRNPEFAERFYARAGRAAHQFLCRHHRRAVRSGGTQASSRSAIPFARLSYARLRPELENSTINARSRQRSRPYNPRIDRPDA
jgi:AcrR family transcriptional regulator